MTEVRKYDIFEWALEADVSALQNPFVQVSLGAEVTGPGVCSRLNGFYDGGSRFVVRYMPRSEGTYRLMTRSNLPTLNGLEGEFIALPPAPGVHGPVVTDGVHFRYDDGAPAFIMGTTAYVWHLRPAEVRERTLKSFADNRFNKIRMLFFPKHYTGIGSVNVSYEPPCYPFEGAPGAFDFWRPNPAYFAEYENRLRELMALGIEADTILFHPYDFGHWDIDRMGEDEALHYLRYLVARISAFRNVWWGLANEYDIEMSPDRRRMKVGYDVRDWDVIGEFLRARDPSKHLISVHNIPFGRIYPDRPWMTHVCYQHPDTYTLLTELKLAYHKPVINDEYQYEGNLPDDWGNSPAELTVERHWRSVMAGGYASHGEAFIRENNRDIFWAYGGDMTGESAPRLRFLREIVEKCPFERMERDPVNGDGVNVYTMRDGCDGYLVFVRRDMPGKHLWLGDWSGWRDELKYYVEVYDAWNCAKVEERTVGAGELPPLLAWRVMIFRRVAG